jgi:hypothetical protein
MNVAHHQSGHLVDANPVASVPAPRLPGHDNLVIEHLHEFGASSVTSLCTVISISDSLSCLRH